MKILVYLSTYNGEKYLKEQLDSVLQQNECELHIYIRDDGSKDNTRKIILEYCQKYSNISYSFEENLGYARSFWKIFQLENSFDFYAFCDQDDIWLPNKLKKAIDFLNGDKETPSLYTSNVIGYDVLENKYINNIFRCNSKKSFYESLQKSFLPGCTFVFNAAAFDIAKKYKGFLESHDWALYSIVSAFGQVYYDKEPAIYYRLHQNNTIGKDGKIKSLIKKIRRFFRKSPKTRSKFAFDFYNTYSSFMRNEKYKSFVYIIGFYDKKVRCYFKLLFNPKIKKISQKIMIFLRRY